MVKLQKAMYKEKILRTEEKCYMQTQTHYIQWNEDNDVHILLFRNFKPEENEMIYLKC